MILWHLFLFIASVHLFIQKLRPTRHADDNLCTFNVVIISNGQNKNVILNSSKRSSFSVLGRKEFCRRKTRKMPALQANCIQFLRPSSYRLSTTSPTFLLTCRRCFLSPIFTLAEFKGPVSCIAIFNSITTFDFYFSMLFNVFNCSLGLTSTFPLLNTHL